MRILTVSSAAFLAVGVWVSPASSASVSGNGGPCALGGSLGAVISIPSGGVLEGDCAIGGNVTSSGLISPGASGTGVGAQLGLGYFGSDTISGDLTLNPTSIIQLDVSSTANNSISVSGALQLGGTI